MNRNKTKSSRSWLQEHFSDQYVRQARKDGYRSRAAYKLLELQRKDHFIRRGMTIVDLGAAPGGWSEVVVKLAGSSGTVIAVDVLPMETIAGVVFIHGDFAEQAIYEQLLKELNGEQVDTILSDMSPNMSGVSVIDQPRSYYLAELALEFAQQTLKRGGTFLTKLFQGEGFENYLKVLRKDFKTVRMRKPKASRDRSKELYLLAQEYLTRK